MRGTHSTPERATLPVQQAEQLRCASWVCRQPRCRTMCASLESYGCYWRGCSANDEPQAGQLDRVIGGLDHLDARRWPRASVPRGAGAASIAGMWLVP